jgi:hypothetical protein
MIVEFSDQEASQLLAALRNWQDLEAQLHLVDEYEAYFEAHEPLTREEIDALCQRIAAAAVASRKR